MASVVEPACRNSPALLAAAHAITTLAGTAHDLGARGVDKNFGNGVVGESLRVALADLPTQSGKAITVAEQHGSNRK